MKSQSRSLGSRDGLEKLFWDVSVSSKSGKVSVLVSVSSRTDNRSSQSRIGLGPQRLVLQAHFQRQKFNQVSTDNKLSAGLISSACRSRTICIFSRHLFIKFIYYQAFVLFSILYLLFNLTTSLFTQ